MRRILDRQEPVNQRPGSLVVNDHPCSCGSAPRRDTRSSPTWGEARRGMRLAEEGRMMVRRHADFPPRRSVSLGRRVDA
jgi:hypothetical protein